MAGRRYSLEASNWGDIRMIQQSLRLVLSASILIFCLSGAAAAQDSMQDADAAKKAAPKTYIDCTYCDMDYIRTEITFVNYVRDR